MVIKIGADVKGALTGIAAVDGAVSKMDSSVGRSAASIRSATGKIVKSFALVSAAAAAMAMVGIFKATQTFASFEQAVTNAASVTGQSGAQYEATKNNIKELALVLGETTVFSAQQAASAMYDLASAGYDVGNMVKADLQPIMDLAAGTQNDLTFATETVTSALGQFGLGIESSGRISDVFAKAIGSSKAELSSLSISMRTVGPVANDFGISIEKTTALLGTLYNAGLQGEQAATGLKIAFSVLAAPSQAVKSEIERLGLTMDDVNPTTRDFTDILDTLKESGVTAADRIKIFGREGAAAIAALMANTGGIRELESALWDSAGAAEEMATKQLATLEGSTILLKSAFESLKISIGEQASPAMLNFNTKLRDAIPTIKTLVTDGFEKFESIIQELAPAIENLKSIFVSIVGIMKDMSDSFASSESGTVSLTDAINALTGAMAAVFRWIDKNPAIVKLAATLGLAAVAFAYVLPVVSAVAGAIGFLITAFGAGGLSGVIAAVAGPALAAIAAAIAAVGAPVLIVAGIIALFAAAWATNFFGIRDKTTAVINVILGIFDWVKRAIGGMSDKMVLLLGPISLVIIAFRHMDEIKEIVGNVINFVEDAFHGMIEFIGPLIFDFLNGFIKAFNYVMIKINREDLTIAELHFTKLEKTIADSATSIEDSTSDISDSVKQLKTDIETTTTDAAASYQDFGNAIASTAEKLTMSMVEAGVTQADLDKRASDIAAGVIKPAAGAVKSISAQMGNEPAVRMVSEQKETNKKLDQLDKLDSLDVLSDISSKLDRLKLEINNYVTNNYKSGGSSGRSGGLVNETKEAAKTNTKLPTYTVGLPNWASLF